MRAAKNPLMEAAPPDVPLARPPLIRVIAQVRFPLVAKLRSEEAIAPFQDRIRDRYPFLRPEQSFGLAFGQDGPVETTRISYWRFLDRDETWMVTLGSDFVGIETRRYTSRNDFLDRFHEVLSACQSLFEPAAADRVGIRYVNRITDPLLHDLRALVRPEVLGIAMTPLLESAEQVIAQNLFRLDRCRLAARWGLLPPRASVDPSAIDPIDERSWVLDLDAYHGQLQPFDSAELVGQLHDFAESIYKFFRWAVTDEFLRRHGGEV